MAIHNKFLSSFKVLDSPIEGHSNLFHANWHVGNFSFHSLTNMQESMRHLDTATRSTHLLHEWQSILGYNMVRLLWGTPLTPLRPLLFLPLLPQPLSPLSCPPLPPPRLPFLPPPQSDWYPVVTEQYCSITVSCMVLVSSWNSKPGHDFKPWKAVFQMFSHKGWEMFKNPS